MGARPDPPATAPVRWITGGPHVISASRRTDLPRFYGEWFAARRRAGFAELRNVYGGTYRVSLRDEDVQGYLFWTRHLAPFAGRLEGLLAAGVPCAVQYTVTGYGGTLEPDPPSVEDAVADLRRVARLLPAGAVEWRYDPIVVCGAHPPAWHVEHFRRLAGRLAGRVAVCNVSLVEPYAKAVRRLLGAAVVYRAVDPARHPRVRERFPGIGETSSAELDLVRALAGIAAEHGIEMNACCDPGLGLPGSSCAGARLFAGWPTASRLAARASGPTRPGCGCLRTVDIGTAETCPAGCAYCYVTTSPAAARRRHASHDPGGVRLG